MGQLRKSKKNLRQKVEVEVELLKNFIASWCSRLGSIIDEQMGMDCTFDEEYAENNCELRAKDGFLELSLDKPAPRINVVDKSSRKIPQGNRSDKCDYTDIFDQSSLIPAGLPSDAMIESVGKDLATIPYCPANPARMIPDPQDVVHASAYLLQNGECESAENDATIDCNIASENMACLPELPDTAVNGAAAAAISLASLATERGVILVEPPGIGLRDRDLDVCGGRNQFVCISQQSVIPITSTLVTQSSFSLPNKKSVINNFDAISAPRCATLFPGVSYAVERGDVGSETRVMTIDHDNFQPKSLEHTNVISYDRVAPSCNQISSLHLPQEQRFFNCVGNLQSSSSTSTESPPLINYSQNRVLSVDSPALPSSTFAPLISDFMGPEATPVASFNPVFPKHLTAGHSIPPLPLPILHTGISAYEVIGNYSKSGVETSSKVDCSVASQHQQLIFHHNSTAIPYPSTIPTVLSPKTGFERRGCGGSTSLNTRVYAEDRDIAYGSVAERMEQCSVDNCRTNSNNECFDSSELLFSGPAGGGVDGPYLYTFNGSLTSELNHASTIPYGDGPIRCDQRLDQSVIVPNDPNGINCGLPTQASLTRYGPQDGRETGLNLTDESLGNEDPKMTRNNFDSETLPTESNCRPRTTEPEQPGCQDVVGVKNKYLESQPTCRAFDCDLEHNQADPSAEKTSEEMVNISPRKAIMGSKKPRYRSYMAKQCPLCSRVFHDSFGVRRHLNNVHFNLRSFPCYYCDQRYKTKETLNSHMQRKHPNSENPPLEPPPLHAEDVELA